MNTLKSSPLGKKTSVTSHYDPSLLYPIPRSLQRESLGIKNLPFHGVDIWNAYELSWLNEKGKPRVAAAVFYVPCESTYLIESKSLKLYLNSFHQSSFPNIQAIQATLIKDLSQAVDTDVMVELRNVNQISELSILPGVCLDNLDIKINDYTVSPQLLLSSSQQADETLYSHLLKSNCPVTHQPDWGSVLIRYIGKQIDHEALLKYIISFRQHSEFHECCIERIFTDIMKHCQPDKLTVYARYTRRGGLDINPFRSNFEETYSNLRLMRQ